LPSKFEARQNERLSEAGRLEPEKFEDQYETALVDPINKKRAGQPIAKEARPPAATS
jgi:non-homologous end joining protein Ku